MKYLLLARHAESDLNHMDFKDFDRPLNSIGESDATLMANQLLKSNINLDYIISSGANRAYSTSRIIAKEINYPLKSIEINNDIYHSSEQIILNIINSVSDKHQCVMLTGHNPTFHHLSQLLSNETILKFPTCSMFSIEFNVKSWVEVYKGTKMFMIYPELFKQ